MGSQTAAQRNYFPGTIHYINPRLVPRDEDEVQISGFGKVVRGIGVLLCLYVLLTGVKLITTGVRELGYAVVANIMDYATHPVLAILVGILITFGVQSSTVITTIVVAAVGSGVVPIETAVMLIMGSNIGTCFTPQLVAFGFFRDKPKFQRALSATMTTWWFNVSLVAFLFPLEVAFHPLRALSDQLSRWLYGCTTITFSVSGLVDALIHPVVEGIGTNGLLGYLGSPNIAAAVSIGLGVIAIMITIRFTTVLLSDMTAASARFVFAHSAEQPESSVRTRSVLTGLGLTLMTQSSSATICSTVPFVGTNTLSLRKAFGIVLGANLGTTMSAMIAAFAVSGGFGQLAMQAAFVHVLFNLIGVVAVMLIRPLGRGIITLSTTVARRAVGAPLPAFIAVLATYILIPFGVIALVALF
ncbi:Na/Pi symporter [Corynebacterium hindlerae]|uniref:Na/Pi symporter n=1 Tax=Corynebacterium hindlerae TaxID=699041 RepID=UPI0031B6A8B5